MEASEAEGSAEHSLSASGSAKPQKGAPQRQKPQRADRCWRGIGPRPRAAPWTAAGSCRFGVAAALLRREEVASRCGGASRAGLGKAAAGLRAVQGAKAPRSRVSSSLGVMQSRDAGSAPV